MLKLERFDQIMWRTIGVGLLIGLLIGTPLALLVGYRLLGDRLRPHQVHNTVAISSDQSTSPEIFRYMGVRRLEGTHAILIEAGSEQSYQAGGLSSKTSTSRARDLLIFDTKSRRSQWVLESRRGIIINHDEIYDDIHSSSRQVKGLVLEVVETNTNNDLYLNKNDATEAYYFDLATQKKIKLMSTYTSLIGMLQFPDGVEFIFNKGGKASIIRFDTKSLTLSNALNLPPL